MGAAMVTRAGARRTAYLRAGSFVALALGVTGVLPAYGEEGSLKDGAKNAGRTLGGVVRDVGQGAKKVGKTVGEAAKEGGREFKKAVKGEN
jgi:hypothetical protein